jgi:hypothetical protein
MSDQKKEQEEQVVEVFVSGVSMSGKAEINNDSERSTENDQEQPDGEKV